MRSLIVAAYTIRKEGLFNLKIAGKFPDYENILRIGVSRQEPRLRDILSRAVASIGPTERGRIANEHVSINVHAGTDYRLLARVAAGSFAVIALMLAWAWQLRRHNHELARISRTDALTGLANRMAIMEGLDSELQRAHRYGRPLSIAMLDLDHFKMINDEHGHLAGDRVLKLVGNILARMVRNNRHCRADGVARNSSRSFPSRTPTMPWKRPSASARVCMRRTSVRSDAARSA